MYARFALLAALVAPLAQGACMVLGSNGKPAPAQADALYVALTSALGCPTRVQELKALFESAKLTVRPAMVANRGIHNPDEGSFSFFETVTGKLGELEIEEGDFFFGHFTANAGGTVVLDQAPAPEKLLIELEVFDRKKRLFNFYELIGTEKAGHWFYRGDSADVIRDNQATHQKPPKFGATLRCSACHSSGGPILKELVAPHNDWWRTERELGAGRNKFSKEVDGVMRKLVDAATFAAAVRAGIERLEASPEYRKVLSARSLPERLRPVFAENEINLETDTVPLDHKTETLVRIPSASVVNPFLAKGEVTMDRAVYRKLVEAAKLQWENFADTGARDADHAWSAPVKGASDLLAIRSLLDEKLEGIDEEFVADVLAIDMANPVFSAKRRALLALVPEKHSKTWREEFKNRLVASSLPGSQELLENLNDPKRDRAFHQAAAKKLFAQNAETLFAKLLTTRKAVFESVLAKNPRGFILEQGPTLDRPAFRFVFPLPANGIAIP